MSGSAENRTSDESRRKDPDEPVLSWVTSWRMLPLVRVIIRDVLEYRERLSNLAPEKARLSRRRHGLSWPERARRYRVEEEIEQLEKALHSAVGPPSRGSPPAFRATGREPSATSRPRLRVPRPRGVVVPPRAAA